MKTSTIILKSVTEANKARYYLEKLKINSVVEKVTASEGGCSYAIKVQDEPEKVCRLLSVYKINCIEVIRWD